MELKVGSLLLGAIREVSTSELVINLPYNTSGTCTAEHTLDGVQFQESHLNARFKIGQLVACAVISNENNKCDVTLRPSIINAGLRADTIAQGMRIPCVVSGIEEHGFMLSAGIEGVKVFLKKRHVDEPENVHVGQIVSVIVGSVNVASGLVTVFQVGENENGLSNKKPVPLESLKPGTLIEFSVKGERALGDKAEKGRQQNKSSSFLPELPSQREAAKEAKTAITEVTFNGTLKGVIDGIHKRVAQGPDFDNARDACDLSVRAAGRGRILAVYPQSHEVHVTVLPHLVAWRSASLPEGITTPGTSVQVRVAGYQGSKVARLVVHAHDEDSDVAAKAERCVGYVHVSRASGDKTKTVIKEVLKIGDKLKGKVMYPNLLEGSLAVSTRPQDAEAGAFAINDIVVGQTVVGTVVKVDPKFLVVAVSDTVAGLVNVEHVKDIPLKTMPPSFAVGMKAKFRVIDVDVEKRRLILTAKRAIATASDEELITGWDTVQEGKVSYGWLVGEKPFGLLVAFPGKVVGIIPKFALASRKEKVEALKKQGRGAVLKVRVERVDKEKKQVTLSMDLDGKSPLASLLTAANAEPDLPLGKAKADEDSKIVSVRNATIKAGEIIKAPLYLSKVDDEAAYLTPNKPGQPIKRDAAGASTVTVVIPVSHLADDVKQATRVHAHLLKLAASSADEANAFLNKTLATGGRKDEPSVIALAASIKVAEEEYVLASAKSALVKAKHFGKKWTDLALYDMRLAYVQKVENFGVFVSFGKWSTSALCQRRQVSDEFIQTAEGTAQPGELRMVMVASLSKASQGLSKAERMAQLATPGEVQADMRPSTVLKNLPAVAMKEFKLGQAEVALQVETLLLEAGEKKATTASVERYADLCRDEAAKATGGAAERLQRAAGKPRSAVVVQKAKSGRVGLFVLIEDARTYAFVPATELDDELGETGANVLDRPEFTIGESIMVKVVEDIKIPALVFTPEGTSAKIRPVIASARPSVVTDTVTDETARPLNVEEISVGQVIAGGVVANSGPQGVFVAISATVTGRIMLTQLSKTKIAPAEVAQRYPTGTAVAELTVLSVDKEKKFVELSAKAAVEERLIKKEHLTTGAVVKARVKKALEGKGLLITVEDSDNVDVLVTPDMLGDSKSIGIESFKKGSLVKAVITRAEEGRVWASLRPSDLAAADEESSEDESSEEESGSEDESMEGDSSEEENGDSDEGEELDLDALMGGDSDAEVDDSDEEEESSEEEVVPAKKAKTVVAQKDEGAAAKLKALKTKQKQTSKSFDIDTLDAFKRSTNEDDDSSDDDNNSDQDESMGGLDALLTEAANDEDAQAASSKLSKRARDAAKRTEEARLRAAEERRANGQGDEEPETVEDFERLLVSESARSLLWMKYMAYYLKLSQLAQARDVAERAVKHGPLMNETDKLNVWLAYLNMECVFGSQPKFQEVLLRAAQYCDVKEVYVQVIRVLEANGKPQQAIEAAATATQKFGKFPDVWARRISLLHSLRRSQEARELLPRALQALPKREHAAFTADIARVEFKQGSAEHGQTLFEGLLATYPKRTDLWSQFFDAMIGAYKSKGLKGHETIRKVFEKATDLEGLKPKKMKFFFKRWLQFEASLEGTTGAANGKFEDMVRSKARTYIEKLESRMKSGVQQDDGEGEDDSSDEESD